MLNGALELIYLLYKRKPRAEPLSNSIDYAVCCVLRYIDILQYDAQRRGTDQLHDRFLSKVCTTPPREALVDERADRSPLLFLPYTPPGRPRGGGTHTSAVSPYATTLKRNLTELLCCYWNCIVFCSHLVSRATAILRSSAHGLRARTHMHPIFRAHTTPSAGAKAG